MLEHISVGNITIQQVIEQEAPFFDFRTFFPSLSDEVFEEHRGWLQPDYLDPATGKIILRIQSYVLRTRHHKILVDPCIGNHKPRPMRPFWHMLNSGRYERNLAATGLDANDIDYVMCTHLHADHVGWNTCLRDGRWVPTFSNAKYVIADRELMHWSNRHKQEPEAYPWITDSVLPIVEAGRAEPVRSDHELSDEVRLIPTPGHTFDHYSIVLSDAAESAIITGDIIHSPLQARYPELAMFSDFDARQGSKTRRKLLEQYCDTTTLFCTAHFPLSSIGRIGRSRDTFEFLPIRPGSRPA